MKRIYFILVALCMAQIAHSQNVPLSSPEGQVWAVMDDFSDDFDEAGINYTSKWSKSQGLPYTTGWYWNNDQNVKNEGGVAKLTMRHNANNVAYNGTYFKSGILQSKTSVIYGYFEARIKGAAIPAGDALDPFGRGVCPSFWLWGFGNKDGVTYSEIDVVELQQFDYYEEHQDDIKDMDLNLHAKTTKDGWRRPKKYPEEQLNKFRASWDPTNDYHTYAVENRPDSIIWYIDGKRVAAKENLYWHLPMKLTVSLGLRTPFVQFYENANHAVDPVANERAYKKLKNMQGGATSMYVDYIRSWNPRPSIWVNNRSDYEGKSFKAGENINVELNFHGGTGSNVMASEWNGMTVNLIEKDANNNNVNVYSGSNPSIVGQYAGKCVVSVPTGGATLSENLPNGHYYVLVPVFKSSMNGGVNAFMTSPLRNIIITKNNNYIDVDDVYISDTSKEMLVGETFNIDAYVLPRNATNQAINWELSNESLATVTNGKVSAIAGGTVVVTASSYNDIKKTCTIVISDPEGDNLLENPGFETGSFSPWIISGSASVVSNNTNSGSKAALVNGNGSVKQVVTLKANTEYSVSCFAKVGANGQSVYMGITNDITNEFVENTLFESTSYVKQGFTFKTGSSNLKYRVWFWNNAGGQYNADDFKLTENGDDIPVDGVELDYASLDLEVSETQQLTATVSPAGASNTSVTWSSSNSNVASVSADGLVTAVAEGTANITVTTVDGGFTALCSVAVSDIPLGSAYYIVCKHQGQKIKPVNSSNGAKLVYVTASAADATDQQWEQISTSAGYFRLKNKATGYYLSSPSSSSGSVLTQSNNTNSTTEWTLVAGTNGYSYMKNKATGNYFRPHSVSTDVIERPSTVAIAQTQWKLIETEKKSLAVEQSNTFGKQILSANNIKVFPCPAEDFVNVRINNFDAPAYISLIDVQGKVISTTKYDTNGTELNTSALEGMYILKIDSDSGSFVQKVIVK